MHLSYRTLSAIAEIRCCDNGAKHAKRKRAAGDREGPPRLAGGRSRAGGGQPSKRFSTSVVFAPPKPKELEMTTSSAFFRAPSET